MGEFLMPSLGADMDTGTVTRWLVREGDAVHRGDVVAVVDTDKADVEVEIFQDGVVDEILVPEGAEVAVGTPLARIGSASPDAPTAGVATPKAGPETRETPKAESVQWHPPRAPGRVSPVVRRLARELGVDLATVTPTGRSGGITRADVERAAGRSGSAERVTPPTPRRRVSPRARRLSADRSVDVETLSGTGPEGAVVGEDVTRTTPDAGSPSVPGPVRESSGESGDAMRAAIARAMARSKREIPHYYLATDVDFAKARTFLDERNASCSVEQRILPAAVLLKATARALRDVPELNGWWVDDALQPSTSVHLGVAISLRGGGLIAPAIHDADDLALEELMHELRDLVRRARAGSLRASELSDPTITVTNLGDQGVPVVHGVIYPPQVALVGFGAIVERPWVVDGMIGSRPIVTATLAADHRASDGVRGARLLRLIDRLLQRPEDL